MKTFELKIATYKGRILAHLAANPSRWYLSSEFTGANSDCPFIGYEAPTILGVLQKQGLVISRWSAEMKARGDSRKEYTIAPNAGVRMHHDENIMEVSLHDESDETVQPALF